MAMCIDNPACAAEMKLQEGLKQRQGLSLTLAGGALLYGASKAPAIYAKPMQIGGSIIFGFGVVLLALTLSSDVTGGSGNLTL